MGYAVPRGANDMMYLWVFLGALALMAAIAWAALHNRQSKGGEARTEAATRDLYQEQDRADKAGETGHDPDQR